MLDRADRTTDRLAQASQDLRNPLAQYLYSALQSANLASGDLQRSDIDDLRKQQVRLDHLSSEVTALAPAIVALDKQKILFGIYMSDLASWRTLVVSQYNAAWKRLIIHLVAIVGMVILLVILTAALRRVTLRYVHDENRRRTILIAERILLWVCIFFIVVLTFASNLGSLATFLGLITAGLAVALQNVILAVLGYTVLVGKLGLRLGDQVQVSGVTGKVVEFGLLQFQVREIDAQGQPTGRLGSFSNSFIFVSPATGIFKLGIEKEEHKFLRRAFLGWPSRHFERSKDGERLTVRFIRIEGGEKVWKQTAHSPQILTLLPPMEVAQAALSRPAEQRVAMAVRFQASSAGTSALSASNPAFRLPLLVLRFSNASLAAYRV